MRHRSLRRLLDQRGRILTLELSGAIFFGSSSDTLAHIKTLLGVASSPSQPQAKRRRQTPRSQANADSNLSWWARMMNRLTGRQPLSRPTSGDLRRAEKAALLGAAGGGMGPSLAIDIKPPSSNNLRSYDSTQPISSSSFASPTKVLSSSSLNNADQTPPPSNPAVGPRPRFLVLDFRRVTAIDMSSVANCFQPLQSLCRDMSVILVYCNANSRVEFYLRSNRLIDDNNTRLMPTLHAALDFCETECIHEELKKRHPHAHPSSADGPLAARPNGPPTHASPASDDPSGGAYSSSLHHSPHHMPLRARAFSLRGAPHLTVAQVLRTLLAIDNNYAGVAGGFSCSLPQPSHQLPQEARGDEVDVAALIEDVHQYVEVCSHENIMIKGLHETHWHTAYPSHVHQPVHLLPLPSLLPC